MHRWLLTQTQNSTATSREITHHSLLHDFPFWQRPRKMAPFKKSPPFECWRRRGSPKKEERSVEQVHQKGRIRQERGKRTMDDRKKKRAALDSVASRCESKFQP